MIFLLLALLSPDAEAFGGLGARRGMAAATVPASFVTSPATGEKVAYFVVTPGGAGPWPVVVVVPGLNADARQSLVPGLTGAFTRQGMALVAFDPPGLGQSGGANDNGGKLAQAALLATLDAVSKDGRFSAVGVVSRSFGVTAATGALARNPHPAKFLVDWEGPPDRERSIGCRDKNSQPPERLRHLGFGACNDEAYWADREAIEFVGKLGVPYQRVQTERDHVHPDNQHAVDMVQAALAGGVPWVRLDDEPVNASIKSPSQVRFLPEESNFNTDIARYAQELFAYTAR
ncbi:MAG: hypothetical protein FJ090_05425 [Deltaproteobacteria bacterium]|nr:hypothetical protein [Deltaproteobacteria bacterium]